MTASYQLFLCNAMLKSVPIPTFSAACEAVGESGKRTSPSGAKEGLARLPILWRPSPRKGVENRNASQNDEATQRGIPQVVGKRVVEK
jgi:hypothetical protein